LILFAGVLVPQLLGQGDRVTDASGAIVPGAATTVIQNGTNTSFKTTSNINDKALKKMARQGSTWFTA
jgi:hypothetical protein